MNDEGRGHKRPLADDVPTDLEERNVRRRDPEGDVVHHLGEFQMATADEEMEKAFDDYDEDDGSLLDPSQVRAGMDRERELMTSLDVAERVRRDEVPSGHVDGATAGRQEE